MKNILNFTLPIIPLDKANHFVYGFIIFIISNFIITTFEIILNNGYSILEINITSLVITMLFALLKEIKDQITYKGFSWYDLIITLIPSILITLFNFLNIN